MAKSSDINLLRHLTSMKRSGKISPMSSSKIKRRSKKAAPVVGKLASGSGQQSC